MKTTRRNAQPNRGLRPGVLLAVECLEPRRAPAAFVVTSALDPTEAGKMTLRDAIIASNATPGPNTITFDIAPGGEQTINLASPLPALTQPVEIFGGSQTDTTYEQPGIVLNGAGAGTGDGFDVNAGNSTIEGFVIEYFSGHGVVLQQSGKDEVINDCIGTNSYHTGAAPNTKDGVFINNVGNNAVQNCIISGNDMNGVEVTGNSAVNNLIGAGSTANPNVGVDTGGGNYIGVNYYADGPIANLADGILIHAGANGTTVTGNVISGNGLNGIHITGTGDVPQGQGTFNTTVTSNFIGTDGAGESPLPNGGDGILIDNGANLNQIGGALAGDANIISGNTGNGVHLTGTGAGPANMGTSGNQVFGNHIGADEAGTTAVPNGHDGVLIDNGANNNTIGGASAGDGNLISGNSGAGVHISGIGAVAANHGTSQNNVVANLIGTDATGAKALANGGEGILIDNGADDNNIGDGTAAGANVISGNVGDGIHIDGSNLTVPTGEVGTYENNVLRNIIGLDVTGANDLGNLGDGILIDNDAQSNQIGQQGQFNVISANFGDGIEISGQQTTLNTVQNNYIGTDITGTKTGLGNDGDGIYINGAPANTIGGSNMEQKKLLDGNLISGNGDNGIEIAGATASGNLVRGNFIGTTLNGAAALANTGNGVFIDGAPNNVIGNALSDTGKDYRNIISGNGENGVSIADGASGNFVVGDIIGTDVTGALALGNTGDGLSIADSPGTTIDNVGTVTGCVISGNGGDGIDITGAASVGTKIVNAYIGVNFGGNAALGNSGDGLVIDDGSQTQCTNDVISGNTGNGVHITGINATANVLQGCGIGVDSSFAVALGNGGDGVLIDGDAFNNMIGNGTTHNTIAANQGNGVEIDGILTTGNLVQGNYIGVTANSAPLGNTLDGVYLGDGAFNNTIGGVAATAPGHGVGNLISANGRNGIQINGALTNQNTVAGNLIGTDGAGANAVLNAADGILITAGASGNIIGAAGFGGINVISGNGAYGIEITGAGASGNIVQNNLIGLNLAGAALGNGNDGVIISGGATANMIGQVGAGLDNIISDNGANGVEIAGAATAGNIVVNNYIGTGGGGVGAEGNTADGVYINGAPRNTIGGGAGAANFISANAMNGVEIAGANGAGNTVEGNFIGTDVTGGVALGNTMDGVKIDNGASFNNVGAAGIPNVIACNAQNGVEIAGALSNLNNVLANLIGTNAAGAAGLGNKMNGVYINAAPLNSIGAAGAGNTICGNTLNGVLIAGPVAGQMNTNVLANFIGVTPGGVALGNKLNGVAVSQASNNFIGGAGAGNTIAFNGKNGVDIISGTENLITQNSISNSTKIGIDLGDNGVTLNTPGGPHAGANDLQNFPVIQSAVATAQGTTVTLSLNSTPGHTFSIELFSSAAPNATGYGEGQTFIIAVPPVVTDANGNATVTLQKLGIPAGAWVTATATDITAGSAQENDTSEFSGAIKVDDANPPTVDNVTFVTAKGKADGVEIFFSEALSAASVTKNSVELFSAGPKGKFTPIALATNNPIVYNATTDTVTLNTAKPIPAGAFIKVFVSGTTLPVTDLAGTPLSGVFTGALPSGNGAAGSDFDALVAYGSKLTYSDAHSNTVTISLVKGGTMELIRTMNGQGQYLELAGVIAGKSILGGTVKGGKTGTGSTTLQGITGLDGATDKLLPPQFVVGNPNLSPLITLSSWEEDLLAPWRREITA